MTKITDYTFITEGDYIYISQNAAHNESTGLWHWHDNARDAFLVEILDSASDQGYIAFKRSDAGVGEISWTEIARLRHDGTLALPALSDTIAAAAAGQLKLFAQDYLGRVTLKKTDPTDEAFLLEGKGTSRVWRQATQPAGAKLWDVWIDTSNPTTTWTDLRSAATAGKTGASNPPTWQQILDDGSGSVGVYGWAFSYQAVAGNEEQLWFVAQFPHSYKQGSDIKAHVHWLPETNGAAGDFVQWGLEYTWAHINTVFGNTALIYSDASAASTATTSGDASLIANKHYISSLGDISGSGKGLSSMLMFRLFRNSSDADDDYPNDAYLLEVDFHFEMDITGSRQEYIK